MPGNTFRAEILLAPERATVRRGSHGARVRCRAQQPISAQHGDAEPELLVLEVVQAMVAPEAAVDGAARAVARVDQEMHPLVVEREREVCGDGREGQRPGGEQRSVDPEQDWER